MPKRQNLENIQKKPMIVTETPNAAFDTVLIYKTLDHYRERKMVLLYAIYQNISLQYQQIKAQKQ